MVLTALANDHDGRDVRDVKVSGVVVVVVVVGVAIVPPSHYRRRTGDQKSIF